MNTVIEARNLIKIYGTDAAAVNGLDLKVQKGECFGILGPNGAGKTTTIEILEGILEPTSGFVEVLGSHWGLQDEALRQRIGLTLQETHLDDRLTVAEILALFRSFYHQGPSVEILMACVSLEEKSLMRYENLSGGQKQRLAVACALAGNPELIFLDEPTTGLDPQSRLQLWELLHKLRAEGRTILLTTHHMEEAERLCDRVAIVDHGKVIALGSPQELIASLRGQEVIQFSLQDSLQLDASQLLELPGLCDFCHHPSGWTLTVDRIHESLPALLQELDASGMSLTDLRTHRASLEDVFVHLTGKQLRE